VHKRCTQEIVLASDQQSDSKQAENW